MQYIHMGAWMLATCVWLWFGTVMTIQPHDIQLWIKEARVLLLRGQFDASRDVTELVLASEPELFDANQLHGASLMAAGRTIDAIPYLWHAVRTSGYRSTPVLVSYISCLSKERRFRSILQVQTALMERNLSIPAVHEHLMRAARIEAEEYLLHEDIITPVLNSEQQLVKTAIDILVELERQGSWSELTAVAAKLAHRYPANRRIAFSAALALHRQGQFAAVINAYDTIIALEPANSWLTWIVRFNRATALHSEQSYALALRELLSLLELSAYDPDVQLSVGLAYICNNVPSLARMHIDRANELGSERALQVESTDRIVKHLPGAKRQAIADIVHRLQVVVMNNHTNAITRELSLSHAMIRYIPTKYMHANSELAAMVLQTALATNDARLVDQLCLDGFGNLEEDLRNTCVAHWAQELMHEHFALDEPFLRIETTLRAQRYSDAARLCQISLKLPEDPYLSLLVLTAAQVHWHPSRTPYFAKLQVDLDLTRNVGTVTRSLPEGWLREQIGRLENATDVCHACQFALERSGLLDPGAASYVNSKLREVLAVGSPPIPNPMRAVPVAHLVTYWHGLPLILEHSAKHALVSGYRAGGGLGRATHHPLTQVANLGNSHILRVHVIAPHGFNKTAFHNSAKLVHCVVSGRFTLGDAFRYAAQLGDSTVIVARPTVMFDQTLALLASLGELQQMVLTLASPPLAFLSSAAGRDDQEVVG